MQRRQVQLHVSKDAACEEGACRAMIDVNWGSMAMEVPEMEWFVVENPLENPGRWLIFRVPPISGHLQTGVED